MIARPSARLAAWIPPRDSLPPDDQIAGEGIALDHALALAVDRLQPSAHAAVLPLRRALDLELQLVAKVAAVRGVGQLEAAPRRIGLQLDVAGDRLRAEVAALGAHSRPLHVVRGGV